MLTHSFSWSQLPARQSNEHNLNQISRGERTAFRHDVKEIFESRESDSSAIQDTAQLNVPDCGTSAPGGDTHLFDEVSGNTVFFTAVMMAEEKFETREIEKLVKEYEFVTEETDGTDEGGYMSSDDEFQLVEYREL
jgi:hypothetical protein